MIGILAAHWIEVRGLVKTLVGSRKDGRVVMGRLRDIPVAIATTGQGSSVAARVSAQFLSGYACQGLLLTGFAGGARPGMAVGDPVVADTVVDPAGHAYRSPYHGAFGWATHRGVLATLEVPAQGPEEKRLAGQTLGCIAVDMESAAMAKVAGEHGVPWAVVRVVLDPMEQVLEVGSLWQAAGLGLSVVGWGRLARFARDLGVAQRRMTDIIPLVVIEMAQSLSPRVTRHDERIITTAR